MDTGDIGVSTRLLARATGDEGECGRARQVSSRKDEKEGPQHQSKKKMVVIYAMLSPYIYMCDFD